MKCYYWRRPLTVPGSVDGHAVVMTGKPQNMTPIVGWPAVSVANCPRRDSQNRCTRAYEGVCALMVSAFSV